MPVVGACPALKMARRRDSACFAHVLGATEREAIRVCRESCVYGRELAMSAEVPATVLPEFVPLAVRYEQLAIVDVSPALEALERIGRLLRAAKPRTCKISQVEAGGSARSVEAAHAPASRKRGRPLGSKNAAKPVPAPHVPEFMVVSALVSAVASYPAQMKRARTSILRKRYNNAAGVGHKYHSYNDFLRDLGLAGVRVVRDKYRVQDSWVMLDDAMQRLITTNQKRAA